MAHVEEHRCPAGVCRAADPLPDRRRGLHRLPGLRIGLPEQRRHRRAQAGPRDRSEALHQVRRMSPGVQVRRRTGGHWSAHAGRKEAEMSAPKRRRRPNGRLGHGRAATARACDAPVTITINGTQFAAAQGETVLDVARREGVDIPALCHQAGSAAWGGCRLCLVEVAGVDKLQAACTTWVADGMSVQTETPRVQGPPRRATCGCTCPTTTPTAKLPAPTPVPPMWTSPGTWRRWPPETRPERPPWCARNCRSPASSAGSARATASRCAGAGTWTSLSPSARCTGPPPITRRPASLAAPPAASG